MKNKKISLKNIINESIMSTNGNCKKMFMSSFVLYAIFLVVYLLTNSPLISFIVYGIFIPSEIAFLTNMQDNNVKIEHIFSFKNQFITYVLLALLSAVCYLFGTLFFVVPAIIIFANYAFIFDVAKDGSNDLHYVFNESQRLSKGFKGKILLLGLIYALILILLIGLGVLIAFLFSLICSITQLYILYLGICIGISLFLLFVAPVMMISYSTFRGIIEQNRITNKTENKDEKNIKSDINENQNNTDNNINELNVKDNVDPTDFIV